MSIEMECAVGRRQQCRQADLQAQEALAMISSIELCARARDVVKSCTCPSYSILLRLICQTTLLPTSPQGQPLSGTPVLVLDYSSPMATVLSWSEAISGFCLIGWRGESLTGTTGWTTWTTRSFVAKLGNLTWGLDNELHQTASPIGCIE